MKKLGVVLALLVLFGTLTVGVGTVSALTRDDVYNFVIVTNFGGETPSMGWDESEGAIHFTLQDSNDYASSHVAWLYNMNYSYMKYRIVVKPAGQMSSTYTGIAVGALVTLNNGTKYLLQYKAGNYEDNCNWAGDVEARYTLGTLAVGQYNDVILDIKLLKTYGVDVEGVGVKSVQLGIVLSAYTATSEAYVKELGPYVYNVQFFIKDALTGQPLTGVTVKEGDTVLGTVNDGGVLQVEPGTHDLTFEKQGYWSVTKTIDVQNDTSVSVEMYPSSAAFKLENFPSEITIPEHTVYTLTFTLSPIDTSATYNTYLSLSGLSDVISVEKDGSVISPEGGKYYLGDISSPTQISIKFKATSVGTYAFSLTLESHDAFGTKTYTTTKQVKYKVDPLPFSIQMPSEWQVGDNELRISEASGQSYAMVIVLKDQAGSQVWSDSHAFSPYEAHTFAITVPSEGSYTLELQWNGQTAVYDITVNPAITLKTKTLTVQKGGEGTIVLHFKNPSSNVQYYTIKVSGGFLPKEINQSISVAPLAEKDVSIAFAVPDNLQYDAYELNVQVLQGNATVFSDKVAVSISEGSGFSLFGGGSSGGKTLYYGLAVLVGLGLFIAILRRR